MEIVRVSSPNLYLGFDRDDAELDEYELEKIPEEVEWIKYWYAQGSYDGSGMMILKTKDGYYLYDMSHCSCYGPLDHLELTRSYDTIEDLINNCSEELEDLLPLK